MAASTKKSIGLIGIFFIAALTLMIVDIAIKMKNEIVHMIRNWLILILGVAALSIAAGKTKINTPQNVFTLVLIVLLILVTIELIRDIPDEFSWLPKKTASTIQVIIMILITVPLMVRVILPKAGFPMMVSEKVIR